MRTEHKNIMASSKRLIYTMVLTSMLLTANQAFAACNVVGTYPLNTYVSPLELTVPARMAIGAVAATLTLTTAARNYASCGPFSRSVVNETVGSGLTAVNGIFPQPNTANWGVRIKKNGVVVTGTSTFSIGPRGNYSYPGVTWIFELVKLANGPDAVRSVIAWPTIIGNMNLNESSIAGIYTNYPSNRNSGATIVYMPVSTCTVSTPNVTIPLGTINTSSFTGAGSTADNVSSNINLSCQNAPRVSIKLTDQILASNATNRLSLTTASSAKNLKAQLFVNGSTTPYTFNSTVQVSASAGSSLAIPVRAQLIQDLAGAVTPGSVNALSTFVFTYQ